MGSLAYAVRTASKAPAFTIAAILTLVLAIGANTAVFTLLEAVALRSLPVQRPEKLAVVGVASAKGVGQTVTYPFYRQVLSNSNLFSDCAAFMTWTTTSIMRGAAERTEVDVVSGNYFRMLGIRPSIGRLIGPDDDGALGANPVAVLSYGYWERRFGGDPGAIGGTVEIATTAFTIIGVAERPFFGLRVGDSPDLYVPLSMDAQVHPGPGLFTVPQVRWLTPVTRIREGMELKQAEAQLRARFNQWIAGPGASERAFRRDPEWLILRPAARGVNSPLRSDFGGALWVTFALVGLVLLIGCGNIANLLLARSQERQHEMAVRVALGAGPWRLARQMLTESILLACAGGGLGVLLAPLGVQFLLNRMPQGQRPVLLDTSVNWRVLLFAAATSVLTGIIFGLTPAIRAASTRLSEALKERGTAATATRTRRFAANALVAGQVAFSLVLLVAAGLFIKTLLNIRSIDAGFPRDHILLANMEPGALGLRGDRLAGFYRRLLERMSSLPGVRSAALARIRLLSGTGAEDQLSIVGYQPKPNEDMTVQLNVVSPAYFATLGIPILVGGDFTVADDSSRHGVAIINQAAARRFFPNENPVGQHIKIVRPDDVEVIGVVGDTKYGDLRFKIFPIVYLPIFQRPDNASRAAIHVRFEGKSTTIVPALESVVRAIDSRLPLYMARTVEGDVEDLLSRERMMATLGLFFGGVALLIAAVGIYGVLMYTVACRRREIGIRMALGAGRWALMRHIVGQSMLPVAIGTLIGLLLAAATARWVGTLLYGVAWTDASIYLLATFLWMAAALIAACVPARHATLIDPLAALRPE
jgi:predicted permease